MIVRIAWNDISLDKWDITICYIIIYVKIVG